MTGRRSILAAHSLGTDSTIWEPLREAVAPWASLTAVDLPGHGSRANGFSIKGASAEWAAFTRTRQPGEINIGLGLGALVVATAAAYTPDRRAVVLISPYVKIPDEGRDRIENTVLQIKTTGFEQWADTYTRNTLLEGATPGVRDLVRAALASSNPDRFIAALKEAMRFDGTDIYPALQSRAIVIRGSDDIRVTAQDAHDVDRLVGGKGVHEIAGAGHFSPLEKPDDVAVIIHNLA